MRLSSATIVSWAAQPGLRTFDTGVALPSLGEGRVPKGSPSSSPGGEGSHRVRVNGIGMMFRERRTRTQHLRPYSIKPLLPKPDPFSKFVSEAALISLNIRHPRAGAGSTGSSSAKGRAAVTFLLKVHQHHPCGGALILSSSIARGRSTIVRAVSPRGRDCVCRVGASLWERASCRTPEGVMVVARAMPRKGIRL